MEFLFLLASGVCICSPPIFGGVGFGGSIELFVALINDTFLILSAELYRMYHGCAWNDDGFSSYDALTTILS